MTIVDIYNQIKSKEPEVKNVSSCWKPTEASDYGEIPKFAVPQKKKQKSMKKSLL